MRRKIAFMSSSPSMPQETAAGLSVAEKVVSAVAIAVLAAILGLVFNAYLAPGMLINFANLVLCS